jgi:DNA-directed RNA polymerase specialized sigma24 family protein
MADLNTGESQVLAMFWEGASLEEIGEAMEIPLNTVKMRLRAARRKMNQTTTSDAAKVAFGSRRR